MVKNVLKKPSFQSSTKYKILHIIPSLVRGGAETLLLGIAKGLTEGNSPFEIRVLTLLERGILADEFEGAGIRVDCIENHEGVFSKNFIGTLRYIRSYGPDIVHTHLWMGDRCGLTAALAAGIRHRITTLHSFETGLPAKHLAWSWVCGRLATGIVAVSRTVKELWTTRRHLQGKKISVIYNSSGFDVPRPSGAPRTCSRRPKLLSLGRVSEEKGQIYTVMAMPRLLEYSPAITYDIYGPSNYGDDYRRRISDFIESAGIGGAVTFMGGTDNPMKVYPRYDVLTTMSQWEGFNMVAIEAMSCGLPVIASDIPVHREVFDNGEVALLVPPGDVDGLREAVVRLLSDHRLYSKLSMAGMKRSADFTRASMIAGYREYYTRLLGIHAPSS